MSNENQIHLKGSFELDERYAATTIKPGYLLKMTSLSKFTPHATEGGFADRIVAEIDPLQGNTLDDNYSSGDLVRANKELPGNEVRLMLKAGENVAVGDELISAGDGSVIKNGSEDSSTTVKQIIAVAMEALDLTDSGDVDTRVHAMFR